MSLTKSRYLAYQQCPKQLWFSVHQRELDSQARQRRLRIGQDVDALAQTRFPEGTSIPFAATDKMMKATVEALEAGVPTIFQATLQHDDLLVRVDILTHAAEGGGWHLIEVKSTTNYDSKKHLADVAFQLYVARAAGLDIQQASLMHLNKECTAPDLSNLFAFTDVMAEAEAALSQVEQDIADMRALIAQAAVPDDFVGRHCNSPYHCPFYDHCWKGIEGLTVYNIPNLRKREEALREQRIVYLDEIPDDISLTANQQNFVSLHIEERVEIDYAAIANELGQLEYPLHFLDFETINPAVPVYDGCWPYQHVPFQYSCHILYEDGTLEHTGFLHTGTDDPRPFLLDQLIDDIQPEGNIVVYYKPFEAGRLQELADVFSTYRPYLEGIIARLWDQLGIFKRHYRHYQFNGSNSLKSVLPVVVPHLSYDILDVQNGEAAQEAWEQLINSVDTRERQQLEKSLLAYCHLDTVAMVEIHHHLCEIVA